jgi:hypothetical protein
MVNEGEVEFIEEPIRLDLQKKILQWKKFIFYGDITVGLILIFMIIFVYINIEPIKLAINPFGYIAKVSPDAICYIRGIPVDVFADRIKSSSSFQDRYGFDSNLSLNLTKSNG